METVLVIVNIVLVLVTAAYVVLTKRMADASDIAAAAAQKSAEAAKEAAQANRESAAAALAGLRISLNVQPRFSNGKEIGFASVHNVGTAAIYIFDVILHGMLYGTDYEYADTTLLLAEDGLPDTRVVDGGAREGRLLHQDETLGFQLEPVEVPIGKIVEGSATVKYSIDGIPSSARTLTGRFRCQD